MKSPKEEKIMAFNRNCKKVFNDGFVVRLKVNYLRNFWTPHGQLSRHIVHVSL
jgi:hypothetical protein